MFVLNLSLAICSIADLKQAFISQAVIYQQNKYYVASEGIATWYDARMECLRSGGDLASFADLRSINATSWLVEGQRYWIGLYRKRWIWHTKSII